MNQVVPTTVRRAKRSGPSLRKKLWQQRYLLLMSVPFIIWAIAFQYLPLAGWAMAFQDFKLKSSLLGSFLGAPFVGLKHFELLWQDFLARGRFYLALRNTLCMSLLSLTIGFAMPIFFALMINELRGRLFKRVVQTVSYLPHFISWVVAAGMISTMLSSEGPINNLLLSVGLTLLGDRDGGRHLEGDGLERDHLPGGHRRRRSSAVRIGGDRRREPLSEDAAHHAALHHAGHHRDPGHEHRLDHQHRL